MVVFNQMATKTCKITKCIVLYLILSHNPKALFKKLNISLINVISFFKFLKNYWFVLNVHYYNWNIPSRAAYKRTVKDNVRRVAQC